MNCTPEEFASKVNPKDYKAKKLTVFVIDPKEGCKNGMKTVVVEGKK